MILSETKNFLDKISEGKNNRFAFLYRKHKFLLKILSSHIPPFDFSFQGFWSMGKRWGMHRFQHLFFFPPRKYKTPMLWVLFFNRLKQKAGYVEGRIYLSFYAFIHRFEMDGTILTDILSSSCIQNRTAPIFMEFSEVISIFFISTPLLK